MLPELVDLRHRKPEVLEEYGLVDDEERFFNEHKEADITSLDENVERAENILKKATKGRLLHKEVTENYVTLGFSCSPDFKIPDTFKATQLHASLKEIDPEVSIRYDANTQLLMVAMDTSAVAVYKLNWTELVCNRATLWLAVYALSLFI